MKHRSITVKINWHFCLLHGVSQEMYMMPLSRR